MNRPDRLRSLVSNPKYIYWFFLAVLSLAAMLVAYRITVPIGAGVGTDGVIYLSNAENLLKGKGLVDYSNSPLLRWPPLYPLLLALLSKMVANNAFIAGWYFNILLYGGMVWLGGLLLWQYFHHEPVWAYLGSLVILTSSSLLSLGITINTDLLFLVLAWGFLLVANHYMETTSIASLLAMTLLAALAAFVRLPGVTLAITGFVLILVAQRKNPIFGVTLGLIFSFFSLLPLACWLVFHNYLPYKVLLGAYNTRPAYMLRNLSISLSKIIHWFISYNRYLTIIAACLLVILFVIMILINKRQDWQRLANKLGQPPFLPGLLFSVIYLLFLIATANPFDTFYPDYDRYQIVLLPVILMLIFALLDELLLARMAKKAAGTAKFYLPRLAIVLVFAVWLVYPVLKTAKYIQTTSQEGEAYYNIYNSKALSHSEIVRFIRNLDYKNGARIYSNLPAAVWFYTREEAQKSPRWELESYMSVKDLLKRYSDQRWPGNQPGYLIWFNLEQTDNALKPKELKKIATFLTLYTGADGEVYWVKPHPQ
jgi:hypothetical protein